MPTRKLRATYTYDDPSKAPIKAENMSKLRKEVSWREKLDRLSKESKKEGVAAKAIKKAPPKRKIIKPEDDIRGMLKADKGKLYGSGDL